jgi:plasmid maintenance system killer protein
MPGVNLMKRFSRDIDREIYETRFTADIPDYVTIAAHETMRVLMAARSLQDVAILGSIVRWHKLPDRYGLSVHGKWHVTFNWSDDFGAYEIALDRH